ncbi:MAG: flagellar protein FliT [Lachnospiraceae bacterium]|nr:flagellar protein FliT [Lachnospiraceae bacterium]
MMDNYLEILEDSLKQKSVILDKITEYNGKQEALLKQEKMSLEDFDFYMEQKDELIEQLGRLDDGFETLYERIRQQLQENKDAHKEQIGRLQRLITQVTEKSVSIQAQETRNKKLVEEYLAREKQQLGQDRQTSKAAYDYYKSMSNAGAVMPQFMDQKK